MTELLPLGDDLLALVLAKLGPTDLATAQCACRRWRDVATGNSLWRPHALAAGAPDAEWPQGGATAAAAGGGAAGELWKQRYLEHKWRRVWSTPGAYTRTVRIEREAHSGEVTSLSTSPCGSLLASSSVDGTVALWDLTAAAAAGPLRPRLLGQAQHPGPVLWVRLLGPDTAASATAGALFLWRMEPQQGGAGGGAMAAASSSSGGSSGGSCRRQLEFRLLRRIAVGGRLTCAAAWDMYLAAGCADGAVRIYDAYSGALSKLLRLHGGSVAVLQHVAHGELDLLVSGGRDGRLLVTDAASTLTLAEGQLSRGGVCHLVLDPVSGCLHVIGGRAFHCCWHAGARLVSLPSPAQRLGMESNARLMPEATRMGSLPVTALALFPQLGRQRYSIAADATGYIHIYDSQGAAVYRFPAPPAERQPQQQQQQQNAQQAQQQQGSSSGGSGASAARPSLQQQQPIARPPGRPALQQPRCTCLSADAVPLAAGFTDGRLIFWRWRRQGG